MNEMRKLMEAVKSLSESSEVDFELQLAEICKARGLRCKKLSKTEWFLQERGARGGVGLEISYNKNESPDWFGWADTKIKKTGKREYMGSGNDPVTYLSDVVRGYFDDGEVPF